jgi:hypothetical protein
MGCEQRAALPTDEGPRASMNRHTRTWLYFAALAVAAIGCSDDDGGQGDAGSGASADTGGAAAAPAGGAGSSGAGSGGGDAGGGASGASGAGSGGGDAGGGASGAGGAGSGGGDAGAAGADAGAAGADAGSGGTGGGGSIVVVDRDGQNLGEFLDVQVTSGFNEQGLLGLAFDPRYQDNGRFFINYTIDDGFGVQTRIESYLVSASDPNVADPTSQELLFSFDQPQQNHNGGMLAFGPDGCLFASTGDGGGGNDPNGNGQMLSTPLGKLLRFDPDDPDNGAPGNLSAAVPHIWDYGLRNPWRFSFDRMTGDLYIGDVGQDHWEEVDVEPAGTGQVNYGWKVMEGMHCRGATGAPTGCDTSGLTLPVDEYVTGDHPVAPGLVRLRRQRQQQPLGLRVGRQRPLRRSHARPHGSRQSGPRRRHLQLRRGRRRRAVRRDARRRRQHRLSHRGRAVSLSASARMP